MTALTSAVTTIHALAEANPLATLLLTGAGEIVAATWLTGAPSCGTRWFGGVARGFGICTGGEGIMEERAREIIQEIAVTAAEGKVDRVLVLCLLGLEAAKTVFMAILPSVVVLVLAVGLFWGLRWAAASGQICVRFTPGEDQDVVEGAAPEDDHTPVDASSGDQMSQIMELSTQLLVGQQRVREDEQAVKDLEGAVQARNGELERLKKEMEEKKEEDCRQETQSQQALADKDNEIRRLRQEWQVFEEAQKEEKRDLDTLLEEKRQAIETLGNEFDQQKDQIAELEKSLQVCEAEKVELEKEKDTRIEELKNQLESSRLQAKTANDGLVDQVSEKERLKQDLQQRLEATNDKLRESIKEQGKLQEQAEEQATRIEYLEDQLKSMRVTANLNRELQSDCNRKQDEIASLQRQLAASRLELQQSEARSRELETSMTAEKTTSSKVHEQLCTELTSAKADLKAGQDENEAPIQHGADEESYAKDLNAELTRLKEKLKTEQEESWGHEKKAADEYSRANKLEDELKSWKQQLEAQEKESEQKAEEIKTIQKRLEEQAKSHDDLNARLISTQDMLKVAQDENKALALDTSDKDSRINKLSRGVQEVMEDNRKKDAYLAQSTKDHMKAENDSEALRKQSAKRNSSGSIPDIMRPKEAMEMARRNTGASENSASSQPPSSPVLRRLSRPWPWLHESLRSDTASEIPDSNGMAGSTSQSPSLELFPGSPGPSPRSSIAPALQPVASALVEPPASAKQASIPTSPLHIPESKQSKSNKVPNMSGLRRSSNISSGQASPIPPTSGTHSPNSPTVTSHSLSREIPTPYVSRLPRSSSFLFTSAPSTTPGVRGNDASKSSRRDKYSSPVDHRGGKSDETPPQTHTTRSRSSLSNVTSMQDVESDNGDAERITKLPPLSILEGRTVNHRGEVLDRKGTVIGECTEGNVKQIANQRIKADEEGQFRNKKGKVIGRAKTTAVSVDMKGAKRSEVHDETKAITKEG